MNLMKNFLCLAALFGLSCAHRIDPAALRLAGRQDLEIMVNQKLATPTLIRGRLADISKVKPKKQPKPLRQFFKENPDIFKLADPEKELRLLRRDVDDLGFTHYRYERLHNGVPIYGDELILHVNDKSEVYQFNGNYHASIADTDVLTTTGSVTTIPRRNAPAISAVKAGKLALEQGIEHQMQRIDQHSLLYYPVGDRLRIAYQVTLRGGMNQWVYFIDAEDGHVLFDQDRRRFQAAGSKK